MLEPQTGEVLWFADTDRRASSELSRFLSFIEREESCSFDSYDALHTWSIENPGKFWSRVWDFCEVLGQNLGPPVVDIEDVEKATFFPEATLNFAKNCLRKTGSDQAVLFRSESGHSVSLSWDALANEVSIAQQILRNLNVGTGDRVVAVMPNVPATVVYMLATASIGAVWSSCSPDFGAGAIVDRFAQIEPKVLLCVNGYTYKSKWHEISEKIASVRSELPTLQATILAEFPGGPETNPPADCLAETELRKELVPAELEFSSVAFNDPLLIMFSSGTSGPPKCIIHSVGGTLLQHLKEHRLHSDLKPGDRIFFYSTCSWMMWNWLLSGLASEATIILFDGSPFYPDDSSLWRMADDLKITHFGTSPKYLDTLRKNGVCIADTYALSSLRVILSTGSPLSDACFRFVYDAIRKDVMLASISGGTDIISCFLLGCPILPVQTGELQCAGLGMDVRVLDDNGSDLSLGVGNLSCRSPFPSRPIGFWGDDDGSRYHEAYYSAYSNAWCQHDLVERTPSGGFIVHGRSDSTLNPGGVRIGTAEIYRSLEELDEIEDAVVVGRNIEDDVEVVLFVVLQADIQLTDKLKSQIRSKIRTRCSPRHIPAQVRRVNDIPRTRNGKISEPAVRAVVNNLDVANLSQLENPECLPMFSLV